MLTHRQTTRRRARAWQLGALGCVLAAGAAFVLPLERLLAPAEHVSASPAKPPKEVAHKVAVSTADILTAAQELDVLVPRLTEEEIEVTEVSVPKPESAPAPQPVAGAWTYIGSIISPTSKRALVKVDSEQQILAEGGTYRDSRVVSVTPTELTIDTGGVQKIIPIASRTMVWPNDPPKRPVTFRTQSAPAGSGGMAALAQPGNPAMASRPPGMSPPATTPPMAPASFDQARAQQMADAARRAQMTGVTPHSRPGQANHGDQETVNRLLSEPNLEMDQGTSLLQSIGIKPGTSVDDTLRTLKERGIEVNDNLVGLAKSMEALTPEEAAAADARRRAIERLNEKMNEQSNEQREKGG